MKELTSYNRVAGYLNKIFDLLNSRFFESELSRPTITIQSTPKALGCFLSGTFLQSTFIVYVFIYTVRQFAAFSFRSLRNFASFASAVPRRAASVPESPDI